MLTGAPLGFPQFCSQFLGDEISGCLMPPAELASLAPDFDELQAHWFSQSYVSLEATSIQQMSLPLRYDGLGLTYIYVISELAYTFSVIDCEEVRAHWTQDVDTTALMAAAEG